MGPWKFKDTLCVACGTISETMDHFVNCKSYESKTYRDWKDSNGDIYEKQLKAELAIENRFLERKIMLEKQEAGQSEDADSTAPGDCRAML